MHSSAPFLFLFLVFAPLVAGQDVCIGAASAIALNYNPLSPSENGDDSDISMLASPSSIAIPVDFSKLPLTVEFWSFWVGKSTITTFPSDVDVIPSFQNQTTFFYGTTDSYIWLTPCNGITPSEEGRLQFPGWYDGKTRRGPAGAFRVRSSASNITNNVWNNQRPGFTHTSISIDATGLATFLISGVADCPSCPSQLASVRLPNLPANGTMYFGSVPYPAVRTELNIKSNSPVKIAEIRVWNTTRSASEIVALRNTRIPGVYPGLVHYWRFDDVSKANMITNGTMADAVPNGAPLVFTNAMVRPQSDARNLDVTPIPSLVPIMSMMDTISATDTYPFTITGKGTTNTGGQTIRKYSVTITSQTPAGFGKICYGVPPTALECQGAAVNETILGTGSLTNTFLPTFFPGRSGCGNTITINFKAAYSINNGLYIPSDTLTATFTVTTPNMTLQTLPITAPTRGANIPVSGANLGVPGYVGLDEYIKFSIGAVNLNLNGSVNTAGTVLNIPIPPGVGTGGNVSVGLCGFQWSFGFDYQGPSVYNVSGVNSSVFRIDGINFGPFKSNLAINDPNFYVLLNGSRAKILSIDHSTIFISSDTLVSGTNYSLAVSIAGQMTESSFLFALCAQECINGGTCVNVNQCSCPPVWLGASCEVAAVCSQNCENGGVCQRTGNLNDPNAVGCVCPPDAPQNAFCTTVDSGNLPYIIGGTVGGAVLLGIIAGAVILFIVYRRPARKAAKDFVPVHKKDFAKIIYGDQLTQSPDRDAGNIKDLDTLLQQDMKAAFAISEITQITEADKIAKALVVVYQDHGKAIQLLEAFIDQEVETSESAGTLFRSNSMVSKMFKFYSRLIGLPYLYVTVGPEISKLLEEELGLEVDPEKMEEGKDLDEMRWSLMSQSQKILKQVLASENECPSQFRDLFIHLKTSVGARFPANINTTIGGFIFLRFFCPAVSSPEAYGIVDEPPSADCRRLLILITKVLQNLSNDVEFGSKEPYMSKMNDFIQSNRAKLSDFYSRLLKPPTKPAVPCVLPKNIKAVSLAILLAHIKENISRVTDAETRGKLEALI